MSVPDCGSFTSLMMLPSLTSGTYWVIEERNPSLIGALNWFSAAPLNLHFRPPQRQGYLSLLS